MTPKDIFVTFCALTGQTERFARKLGVGYFLPALFRLRYSNMGGLDIETFARQLSELKTFEESAWCSYWNSIAEGFEREADEMLELDDTNWELATEALIKAMTYYQVSAFPGDGPKKMEAYFRSRELFDRGNKLLGDLVDKVVLEIAGEELVCYSFFPEAEGRAPVAIITNGLEGTVQEICIPNIKYQDRGMGMFVMEMPGSYAYKKPMSAASEDIYRGVIDHVASLPQVDTDRIYLIGVSFGGYWAARMAARDSRISKAVVCGAPLQYAFGPQGSIGTPEIIISALKKVTGAGNLKALQERLDAMSFDKENLYACIKCPTLIINGDNDTLVGTKDSIVLNAKVPRSFLKLYVNDDHCAMGHYDEWLGLTVDWLMGTC